MIKSYFRTAIDPGLKFLKFSWKTLAVPEFTSENMSDSEGWMCCLTVTWYSDRPLIQVESFVNLSNFANFDPPDLYIICRNHSLKCF